MNQRTDVQSPPTGLAEAARTLSDKALYRNSHWYVVPKSAMDALRAALEAQALALSDDQVIALAVAEYKSAAAAVEATHRTKLIAYEGIIESYKRERNALQAKLNERDPEKLLTKIERLAERDIYTRKGSDIECLCITRDALREVLGPKK